MAGGKSTPKKDKMMKVSGGQLVKTGELLARGVDHYKAGKNTKGTGTIFALCTGKVLFTRKKSPRGSVKTYINVVPA